MSILSTLKTQLAHLETEFEEAKAHCSRCDGAIQVVKHLISEAETETQTLTAEVKGEAVKIIDDIKEKV